MACDGDSFHKTSQGGCKLSGIPRSFLRLSWQARSKAERSVRYVKMYFGKHNVSMFSFNVDGTTTFDRLIGYSFSSFALSCRTHVNAAA